MVIYKVRVQDGDGDFIGEFDVFKNLQFGKRLNNYGSCQVDVPVNSDKASSLIALRQYSLHIYRNDVLIWAGEQASRQGNLKANANNWVTIYAFGWFEQLNSRYTPDEVIFSAVDAGDIAWSLINTSQGETNGSFGITEGTIEATQNRDRTYNNKNIADAIVELSNVINGFDFEINDSKVFDVYASQGVDRSADIVLEYGINITDIRITDDFSKPVNRAIVLGDSGDPMDALRVDTNNTGLQTIYKIREGLTTEPSVSELGTLTDKGEALNRKYGNSLVKLSMGIVRSTTPTIEDFAIGDIIRLKVQSGIYNIDENYRIFEWSVNYQEDNTETLSLVLGKFTIEPWS